MECLKVLCAVVVGLTSVGRAEPQFDTFDIPASPLHKRDPLLASFDGLPSSFGNDFGSAQSFAAGFPAGLYPSTADFGFGGVSPPAAFSSAAAGFAALRGLATPLPAAFSGQLGSAAAFPFSAPVAGSPQTYTISADGQLVPVPPAQPSKTPVQSGRAPVTVVNDATAAPEGYHPSKTDSPAGNFQSARDYDNDGINTTPSPRAVFGAVPDPAVVLKPPPSPTNLDRPGNPNEGGLFAGDSNQFSVGPSPQQLQTGDVNSVDNDDDNPNPLPGRPFDYSKSFPSPSRPQSRPINVVAFGSSSAEPQKYDSAPAAPQTYATSVSPTPSGFYNNDPRPNHGPVPQSYPDFAGVTLTGFSNINNNSPNPVSGNYYRQQLDNNNNNNVYSQSVPTVSNRPLISQKPIQTLTVPQSYSDSSNLAVFSNNNNSPNPVSSVYFRQQLENNNNDYSQSVPTISNRPIISQKQVQTVTVPQSYPDSANLAVFSNNNSPNSVSGNNYRQQFDNNNNNNVYSQSVTKPVQSVTVLQSYGGPVSGNNNGAPNSYQPFGNSYGDSNASVQNSFNELATFLSNGAAGKPGNFGGDSNSISANNKRESFGGRGNARHGVEYKRD